MYVPEHFEITDTEEIFEFIEANSFGQLISNVNGKLLSTHLPFLVEKKSKVIGHLAAQNPQHQGLDGQEVLVTLEGAHDYISPSWYEGSGVPTWNYQAAHIYGRCTVFRDADRLREVVVALSRIHESSIDQPWQLEFKASMLRAIVGVEIEIREVQCKYKLSQNRTSEDRLRVIDQLKKRGSYQLAAAMERNEQ